MDSVFSLSYPEYAVAKELQSIFKQKDGYSILIPLSRQQKGYDLVLYNVNSRKSLTIQIKSSRAYQPTKRRKENPNKRIFDNYLWFRCSNYKKAPADYYIFFGLYQSSEVVNQRLSKNKTLSSYWEQIYLAFSYSETKKLFHQLKMKAGKAERFFGLGFNSSEPEDIFITRGLPQLKSYKHHLLGRQIRKLKIMLR